MFSELNLLIANISFSYLLEIEERRREGHRANRRGHTEPIPGDLFYLPCDLCVRPSSVVVLMKCTEAAQRSTMMDRVLVESKSGMEFPVDGSSARAAPRSRCIARAPAQRSMVRNRRERPRASQDAKGGVPYLVQARAAHASVDADDRREPRPAVSRLRSAAPAAEEERAACLPLHLSAEQTAAEPCASAQWTGPLQA